jgi:hypothetical protein
VQQRLGHAAEPPANRTKPARADHDRLCVSGASGEYQSLGRRSIELIELDVAAVAGVAPKLLEHVAPA